MAKNNSKDTVSEEFVFDRFEEDKAVLIFDKTEIILPKNLIPKDAKEGEVLVLTIATSEAETKRREAKAKEILNEILNIGR